MSEAPEPPISSSRDLTVEYTAGDYVVRPLDEFNLDAPDGSLVILLGPSGCGKTTLLSALAGILTPTSRHDHATAGRTLTGLTGKALTEHRRHGVGVVFQAFNLVPSLDAIENVMAPHDGGGRAVEAKHAPAPSSCSSRSACRARATTSPATCPAGSSSASPSPGRSRLDPPLILADEPTAHLDYIQVEGVLRIVRGLAGPGRVVRRRHPRRPHDPARRPGRRARAPVSSPSRSARTSVELAAGRARSSSKATAATASTSSRRAPSRSCGSAATAARTCSRRSAAGDYFGEMGPLFGLPRSATARADRTDGGHRLLGEGLPRQARHRTPRRHRQRGQDAGVSVTV